LSSYAPDAGRAVWLAAGGDLDACASGDWMRARLVFATHHDAVPDFQLIQGDPERRFHGVKFAAFWDWDPFFDLVLHGFYSVGCLYGANPRA
jgi:hypothetical protein